MLRAFGIGAIGALSVIGVTLGLGCGAVLGPAVCGTWRGYLAPESPVTVKSIERHEYYRARGLSAAYAGRSNPLRLSIPLVLTGVDLYDLRCAICHGPIGHGNGAAAAKLDAPPADLAGSVSNDALGDDFFFWTIAEGGDQFGSDMPPFKNDLSEQEIWVVIAYLRAAFEERNVGASETDGSTRRP